MARKKKPSSAKSFFKIFFWLLIIFTAIYYATNFFIIKPYIFYPGFGIQIPDGYQIHGIDVSRYQRTINWEEVKEMEEKGIKIGFVFIKATEGKTHVDARFKRNWLNAEIQNIPKGAYHFFIPGTDAVKQANNFIQAVTLRKGDLPPVLDVEKSGNLSVGHMQDEVRRWLKAVENEFGVKPIIYTNIFFFEKYFHEGFEEYPLWIAHYLQPDKPRITNEWVFWQHSDSGRVNGIKSNVDFNVFNGDSTQFNNLLIQ